MSDDLTRCPCCEGEGYFYGDETPPSPWGDADEIIRLRTEVERLTKEGDRLEMQCFRQGLAISALRQERDVAEAALADERAHADVMAGALTVMAREAVELAESGDAGYWDPEAVESMVQTRAALSRHRARRQG